MLKTLFNFGFSGLRMAVAAVGGFIVSVMIARSLGVQDMGTFSFVVWTAGTVSSLSSLGLPDAVSKYVAEHKGVGNHVLAAIIARRILFTQILSAAAATILAAALWGSIERHRWLLILLALATVLPAALQQTMLALMEGEQRFDLQVLATLGGTVFQIAIVAIFAVRWPSVEGFLLASLISSVVLLGTTYFFSRSMIDPGPKAARPAYPAELSRRVLSFSLSIYGLWLLNLVVFDKSEMAFLRLFNTPEQLAYYGIAFTLTARLATAGDSISYVLFPMFITRLAETGAEGLKASYRQSITYMQMLMVPLCLWAIPLLPALVVIAYGQQYARVVPVIQILLVTMIFSVTMNVSSNVVYALDKQASLLHFMMVVAALNILLDLALIPRYAAVGAAVANGASQAIAAVGLVIILRKLLPGSFPARTSLKVYFAAIISTVPIICVDIFLHGRRTPFLVLSVLIAVFLYGAILTGMRTLSKGEVDTFRSRFATVVTRRAG